MSNNQKRGPGSHYSGANPIPNIQRFVESLDADKKERDARIEENLRAKRAENGVIDHKPSQATKSGTRKVVTDPTTGRNVEIEDVNKDFMKAADNPIVNSRLYSSYTHLLTQFTDICSQCESWKADQDQDRGSSERGGI
jgi:hypothetical protein